MLKKRSERVFLPFNFCELKERQGCNLSQRRYFPVMCVKQPTDRSVVSQFSEPKPSSDRSQRSFSVSCVKKA